MNNAVALNGLESEFLNYLLDGEVAPGERLPTLAEISDEIGISVGKLREQLEVARAMGLVSVRPRIGTLRESFDFLPSVRNSALFALGSGEATFDQISELRRAIEAGLWSSAVVLLDKHDHERLRQIVSQAWQKLRGDPIHIPNREHRQLHLTIFSRLENPFVKGMLQAYWEIYEASELTRWASYQYWLDVWTYHERIVEAICVGEFDLGRRLLVEHFQLLPRLSTSLNTELADGEGPRTRQEEKQRQ
jgi:DNA-binding FadR family transcriptional regulator